MTPTGERDTGGGIPVKEEGAEKGTMFAVYIKAFTKAVNGEWKFKRALDFHAAFFSTIIFWRCGVF